VHVSADRLTLDERIHFEFDKATIRPVSYSILDEVAATLLDHPEILTVEIEGHADERGTHAYNQGLSDRRAKSVRQYLVSAGVEGDRLRTRAYGETDPAVDGDTEAAYRANRRVQFTILASTDRDEATASGDATNPTDTTTDSDTETR
jgi:outer membrane protein OmpA-like peptidoglycan-associated protein